MRVGVIGLGTMGTGAARNLVAKGHDVVGCDLREAVRAELVAAGGQACFSVRARDRAGNVSTPSAWACAAVPLDDRSMSASSGTARHLQLGALGGTSTGLTRSGAYVALAGQQGRQLALIALQGPGQGSVDVWAAGVKVGHVNLAYGTWRRVVVLLPVRPFRGTVMVNSVATTESRIDAVAVLR